MVKRKGEKETEEESSTLFHFVLARPDDEEEEDNKDIVLWEHRLQHGRCPHCGNLTHIRCNGGAEASRAAMLVPRNAPPLVKRGVCTHPDCQPEQRFVPCYFTPRPGPSKNSKDGGSSIHNSDSPLAAVDEWLREMREKYKQLKKVKSKKDKQKKKSLAWLFEDVLTQLSRAVTDCSSSNDCDKQELLEKLEDMEMQLDGGRSLLDELQREIGQDLSAGKIAVQRLMDYQSGTDDSELEKAQSDDEQELTTSTMAPSIATTAFIATETTLGSDLHPGYNALNSPNNLPRKEEAGHSDSAHSGPHQQDDAAHTITPIRSGTALAGGAGWSGASSPPVLTPPIGGGVMAAKARWARRPARTQSENDSHLQGRRDAERRDSIIPFENAAVPISEPEPLLFAQSQYAESMSIPGEGQPFMGRLDSGTEEKGVSNTSLTAPSSRTTSRTLENNDENTVCVSAIPMDHEGSLIRSQQSQIRLLRERVEQLDQGQQLRLEEIAEGIQQLQQFSSSVAPDDGSEVAEGSQQLQQVGSSVASSDGGFNRGSNHDPFEISTELQIFTKNKNKVKKGVEVKAMAENMKTQEGVYRGEILIQRQRFQLKASHLRHGSGIMTYKAGDTYEGEWYKDKRHGKGTYRRPDGKEYDGEWEKDYANGNGVMKFPDGSVYSGGFKNHKRHGKGVLMKRDGSCYDCEWLNDVQNGKGIYTSPDGQQYQVLHRDGRLVKKK